MSVTTGGLGPGRGAPAPARIWFDRRELDQILKVYGRMVAAGAWRDYAIDALTDSAVFSVFRRASEAPTYRIEKHPALAARHGAYCLVSGDGLVLKRGRDLAQVLRFFDRQLMRLVDVED